MVDNHARNEIQYFDRKQDYYVFERRLPHWSQPGTLCFITFRLDDSMPISVLDRWRHERWDWLGRHGIDPRAMNWRESLAKLPDPAPIEFRDLFWNRWDEELDKGCGSCILKQPALAQIVAQSLLHFDNVRYTLTDFVVMPNHVHLLAAFSDEAGVLTQCKSWKHYTAVSINRKLGRKGSFWQQDGFDHLVRSPEAFAWYREYIANNPRRANLATGEFLHYSKTI